MTDKSEEENRIGGDFCNARIGPLLLPREGQELTPHEREGLWKIFQAIGRFWNDLHRNAKDSSTLKSSWLEFIDAKTRFEPSYVAEYSSAVLVVQELTELYGEEKAYEKLFTLYRQYAGKPPPPPDTRLEHAKRFVVDEFIRVNVVASGFKSFGPDGARGRNYKGYLGGSRYNIRARVRHYEPESTENE